MKKLLFFAFLIPLVSLAFDASGEYSFDYFYFFKINYFSAHTIIGTISNESDFVKFYCRFHGRFYNGDSKYVITYPGIDFSLLDFVPPAYIQMKNDVDISQIYLSFYIASFNIKIGRTPLKWGISEIYSPSDIFTREIPFNVYSINTGIEAVIASYSMDNLTFSAVYQDESEYENTKQGVSAEYIFPCGVAKVSVAHLFIEQVNLLAADTIENFMGSISFISDYLKPGLWFETVLFSDEKNKRLYITAGGDYTFFNRIYMLTEGFVNFSGTDAPYSDLSHINRLLNGNFIIGKYYLFSNILLNRGEKIEVSIISATNLDDLSSIAGFILNFVPKSYIDISLGAVGTTGDLRDEFFKMPFISYFEIKYIF
ncbi:MAG: hypothetical protein COX48_01050 [bacterium (Candidatus Stahlbacteria) CG23_combo_of_CG06-09_8_20_14_all_34_7]|nr:MAG: hypothetical protein COX48_01050 [bacterium (Candidatus Stahlbacteria) CG23_combo_of_CG06-09_8_20_14_all_34_7]